MLMNAGLCYSSGHHRDVIKIMNYNSMDYHIYALLEKSNHPYFRKKIESTTMTATIKIITTILTLEHLILNFVYEELLYIFTDVASLLWEAMSCK